VDARFPNALKDGSFNPVNLPVEITGVGFFDHAHGQIGRAANNIELHPILRLCFLDGPTPQCSTPGPGSGGPPVAGSVVQTASAPFAWMLVLHRSGASPTATIEVVLQGTGAGRLRMNFFAAGTTLPSDSFDSGTKIAVKNINESLLPGIVSALGSAASLTVTTTSSGQPPQFLHEVQFTSKTP
jgi:hypothetical protein